LLADRFSFETKETGIEERQVPVAVPTILPHKINKKQKSFILTSPVHLPTDGHPWADTGVEWPLETILRELNPDARCFTPMALPGGIDIDMENKNTDGGAVWTGFPWSNNSTTGGVVPLGTGLKGTGSGTVPGRSTTTTGGGTVVVETTGGNIGSGTMLTQQEADKGSGGGSKPEKTKSGIGRGTVPPRNGPSAGRGTALDVGKQGVNSMDIVVIDHWGYRNKVNTSTTGPRNDLGKKLKIDGDLPERPTGRPRITKGPSGGRRRRNRNGRNRGGRRKGKYQAHGAGTKGTGEYHTSNSTVAVARAGGHAQETNTGVADHDESDGPGDAIGDDSGDGTQRSESLASKLYKHCAPVQKKTGSSTGHIPMLPSVKQRWDKLLKVFAKDKGEHTVEELVAMLPTVPSWRYANLIDMSIDAMHVEYPEEAKVQQDFNPVELFRYMEGTDAIEAPVSLHVFQQLVVGGGRFPTLYMGPRDVTYKGKNGRKLVFPEIGRASCRERVY
jgi:hypothetical protein